MFRLTILLSTLLVLIGIAGYALGSPDASGSISITALIPTFFGFALLLLTWISLHKSTRTISITLMLIVSLLGMIGSGIRLPVTFAKYSEGGSPLAFICQLLMAIVCLVYIIIMIRSFIILKTLRDK